MNYLVILSVLLISLSVNNCAVHNAQLESTLSRAEQSRGAEIGKGRHYGRTVDGIVYQINNTRALVVDGEYAVKIINHRKDGPSVYFAPLAGFSSKATFSYTFAKGKENNQAVAWLAPGKYLVKIFVYSGHYYRTTGQPDAVIKKFVGNAEHRIAECDTVFGEKVEIH